ncbi:MAG: thermonuclease family protein [Patescibacteria group bacterium]
MKKLVALVILIAVAALAYSFWPAKPAKIKHSATGNTETARVVKIIDGDTIEIEGGLKIRYIGVNTPETKDPRRGVQCFGKEASAKNQALVEGQMVWLEKDVGDRDKYGRLLRYVWVGNNTMVNETLVKEGYAFASSYPPNVKYQKRFREAERQARNSGKGLWSSCPDYQNRKKG